MSTEGEEYELIESETGSRKAPVRAVPFEFKPSDTARIHVWEQIAYIPSGAKATVVTIKTGRNFEDKQDQPYQRIGIKVGEAWQKIDIGWAKEWTNYSLMIIENTGVIRQVTPTEDEKAETETKVLEVCIAVTGDPGEISIPVGDALRWHPTNPDNLYIRCKQGETRFAITIFPG